MQAPDWISNKSFKTLRNKISEWPFTSTSLLLRLSYACFLDWGGCNVYRRTRVTAWIVLRANNDRLLKRMPSNKIWQFSGMQLVKAFGMSYFAKQRVLIYRKEYTILESFASHETVLQPNCATYQIEKFPQQTIVPMPYSFPPAHWRR